MSFIKKMEDYFSSDYFKDWLRINEPMIKSKITFRRSYACLNPFLAIGVTSCLTVKAALRGVELTGRTLKFAGTIIGCEGFDAISKSGTEMLDKGAAVAISAPILILEYSALLSSPLPLPLSSCLQKKALLLDIEADRLAGGYPLSKAVNEVCREACERAGATLRYLKEKNI